MFNNYRIPRENLLNKTGDVTPDGQYESVFSEPTKILGAALESFSAGRIGIMQESSNTLADAIVIAVRFAAVRKQFGHNIDGPEIPIIEYQLHVSCKVPNTIPFQCFSPWLSLREEKKKEKMKEKNRRKSF